jgi:trans-2,3-dihydro-3-hydroxyanthranilate isomerase
MQHYLIDVFTDTPGMGNPAAVVIGDGALAVADMAAVAARLGIATTFIDPAPVPSLSYLLPSGATMALCGHGTLAALAVLARHGRRGRFTIGTPSGELPVSVEAGLFGLGMRPPTLSAALDPTPAASALGIDVDAIGGEVQVGSAGRAKLLVPLRSIAALDALAPDPRRVAECCAAVGATGLYAFTTQARSAGTQAEARHFTVGAGFAEDPVTGVAAVALAAWLWQHGLHPAGSAVRIGQGQKMGRPGVACVHHDDDGHTWLRGQALLRAVPAQAGA